MKKLQMTAVLILSLFFAISCVSDDDDEFWGEDQADTLPGGNSDVDSGTTDDTLPDGQQNADTDSSDTNPDNTDTAADPTNPTTDPTNPTTDPTNPTTDPTDPTTDPTNPTDPTEPEPTPEEKCLEAGGTWGGGKCTKEENCGDKPANTEWNGNDKFTQTLNGTEWIPAAKEAEYGEGECGYKCAENYFWNDTACVDPCGSDPCAETDNAVSGSCNATDAATFTCGCIDEYHWENNECTSNLKTEVECTAMPDNAHWNTEGGVTPVIDQNWICENDECGWSPSSEGQNGTQTEGCYFSCNENYDWIVASEIGKCLQECSLTSEMPCKDSTNGRIWSARAQYAKEWSEAKTYCANLEEGGYPKGTWQLPTISDLRTIIVKCTYNMPEGSCGVTDECMTSSCYDQLKCNSITHSECKSDTSGCGSHSKLCETNSLWSLSKKDGSSVWVVKFSEGNIGYAATDDTRYVRCVIK